MLGGEQRCGRARGRCPISANNSATGRLRRRALLLTVLARTVGIGGAGWLVGLASGLTLNLALARALWRDPSAGARLGQLGDADARNACGGVAALTAASFERPVATATLVTLRVDRARARLRRRRLARRTGTESAPGAKLDGEVDAFLILVLSIEVARRSAAGCS
jgi:hypothetical protein